MAAKPLPTTDTILVAMKLSETSVEAAQYVSQRLHEIITKAKKQDECKDLLDRAELFVRYVEMKLQGNSHSWIGKKGKDSEFHNMQANMAATEAATIKEALGDVPVNVDVAINQLAKIMRGYSANGKGLDPQLGNSMDVVVNAFWAENNKVSKDSTLYNSDADGNIQEKADPEEAKEELVDPEAGLGEYCRQNGLEVTVQLQTYPGAEVEQPKRREVEPSAVTETAPTDEEIEVQKPSQKM